METLSKPRYLEALKEGESFTGTLDCSGTSEKYSSCEEFMALRERGCYGYTTGQMNLEGYYGKLCEKKAAIAKAQSPSVNYFELESENWWESLPAELIPLPGGIYSMESEAREKAALAKMTTGKLLGDLNAPSVEEGPYSVTLVLSTHKTDCGTIQDVLDIAAVLLADFDDDGIAELLITGNREEMSGDCSLGSGKGLGSEFDILLKKDNPRMKPVVLPLS